MNAFPFVAVAIVAVLVALLAVLFIVIKRKGIENVEADYRVFFILGITWLPLGIATDNMAFLAIGAVFMIVGLANRDKWPEEEKWSDLTPPQRRIRLAIILGLTLLVAAGVVFYFLAR